MTRYLLAAIVALSACGRASVEQPIAVSTTTPTATIYEPGSAHSIVVEATACWFGGVWNEALDDYTMSPRSRCSSALSRAYPGAIDPGRFERLRAAEPVEVSELSQRVSALAGADPKLAASAADLGKVLVAVGAAEQEHTRAHLAAERVKRGRIDAAKVGVDDLAGARALGALFALEAGSFTAEARTIASMIAVERLGLAIDLPKHLKVIVVQGAVRQLFDLYPPPMTTDPEEPLPAGTWLAYLEDIAKAARHPVPDFVDRPTDREELAWAGMLAGAGRRVRAESERIQEKTELTRAADGVARRLDQQFRATEAAILTSTLAP